MPKSLSRLRIGVYDPDPATLPRIGGVLEARAPRGIELRGPRTRWAPVDGKQSEAAGWLESLADGEVDLAICPIEAVREILDERVAIIGVPKRGDPRDVLLGKRGAPTALRNLPSGATVLTYSKRTAGLVRAHGEGLEVLPGGDLSHDLAKVDRGAVAAVVSSYNQIAGTSDVERIGEAFPVTEWIPSPGQGALAILTRTGEASVIEVAEHLVHADSMRSVRAELATAQMLDLEDSAELGVVAMPFPGGMRLWGMVVAEDGVQLVRAEISANGGPPAEPARHLCEVLTERGARRVGRPKA
ncbi:MAG: hypothetical protein ACR2QM_11105 [Longimicrobiales bacterium]